MVYNDPGEWERQRDAVEAEWPEYRDSTLSLSRPGYQGDEKMSPSCWKQRFLDEDVEQLQQHKQHHVHLPTDPHGERQPLAHCRDLRDPKKCKSGFPRTKWTTEMPLLICKGIAECMEMPVKGKKSMLGLIWGPVNDPNLNGTHPALLASLRCNSDVQVPYRFPITDVTHNSLHCPAPNTCIHHGAQIKDVAREAQRTQTAQAGYACDYQNKRLPIAVHEIKEWQKAQKQMSVELQHKPAGYVGARASKRFITDCYARGVCRGAVECTNLVTQHHQHDSVKAETVRTAQVTEMALSFGLRMLEATVNKDPLPSEPRRLHTDNRVIGKKKTISGPFWTLYGGRGGDGRVFMLSAYEFARHYQFKLASFPQHDREECKESSNTYHAELTNVGKQKIRKKMKHDMQPCVDYRIIEDGGMNWAPLGHGDLVQPYRHDWVIVPRKRPYVPVIFGAQGAKTDEEQAMRVLLLFCPWTNNPDDGTRAVPYIGNIRQPHMTCWRQALRHWLWRSGLPTETVKRYILNFCFVYCLPRELQPSAELHGNSDDEGIEDECIHFEDDDLLEAMHTHVRGGRTAEEDGKDERDATILHTMTKEMFELSKDVWMDGDLEIDDAVHAQYNPFPAIPTDDKAIAAARLSRTAGSAGAAASTASLPTVSVKKTKLSTGGLHGWLNSDKVVTITNRKQYELTERVVQRVMDEYNLE
eukprot:3646435-Amphidinium_carterae.4